MSGELNSTVGVSRSNILSAVGLAIWWKKSSKLYQKENNHSPLYLTNQSFAIIYCCDISYKNWYDVEFGNIQTVGPETPGTQPKMCQAIEPYFICALRDEPPISKLVSSTAIASPADELLVEVDKVRRCIIILRSQSSTRPAPLVTTIRIISELRDSHTSMRTSSWSSVLSSDLFRKTKNYKTNGAPSM